MGVAGAPVGVLVLGQQTGCLDTVVGHLAFALAADKREVEVAAGDPVMLGAGQAGCEPAKVDAEQPEKLLAALRWKPGGCHARRLQITRSCLRAALLVLRFWLRRPCGFGRLSMQIRQACRNRRATGFGVPGDFLLAGGSNQVAA